MKNPKEVIPDTEAYIPFLHRTKKCVEVKREKKKVLSCRGGKLWEGKYMKKIMKNKGYLVKFVHADFPFFSWQ